MRFVIHERGTVFSTRPRGAALLAELHSEAEAEAANVVQVDFEGVESISYSFADEFVGTLMQRAESGEYGFDVVLEGVPTQHRSVILRSLRNRGLEPDADELFELAAH
jgi:hypothetical protein